MIIDIHCHVWEEESLSKDLRDILVSIANTFGADPNLILDGSAERLIRNMDEAGIDKTVIVAVDYEFLFRGEVSFQDYNNQVAEMVDRFPDRLIGFAGIDPRRGEKALVELERCTEDLGLKGVKLWPLTGFYPDDKDFYPFYELIVEKDVPILCHTGSGPFKTYLKFCRPAYVDTIAVDFPKMKIIMAHIGDPWVNEALTVAGKNLNVYTDLSAWEPIFKFSPIQFFQMLLQAKMTCGIDKILLGTDWPLFTPIMSLSDWVRSLKKLELPPPLQMMGMPEFTTEESEKILGKNAQKILQ
ncbi:MAG: amidohydrolase family protein [Candidatus Hodarchaeales archaeon]